MVETSMLDKDGWLKQEYVRDFKFRDFSCPGCRKPSDNLAGYLLITNRVVACDCGESYDMFSARVVLTPENPSWRYLKEEPVRSDSWYHSTSMDNWEKKLLKKTSFDVHLGTEAAAFDRALSVYAPHGPWASDFYLYEVRLKPEVVISPRIVHDDNEARVRRARSDVTRYINRWESPASISLAARSTSLEVIGFRKVTVEEAHSYSSIYNIRFSSLST